MALGQSDQCGCFGQQAGRWGGSGDFPFPPTVAALENRPWPRPKSGMHLVALLRLLSREQGVEQGVSRRLARELKQHTTVPERVHPHPHDGGQTWLVACSGQGREGLPS